MKVELIATTQGQGNFVGKSAEDIIVYAARVSSSREDKFEKPEGLLKYCIRNKHWSIFETASMTVEITTSRAIATQLLRHRSFQFQQKSQRYNSDVSIEPVQLRKAGSSNRQSSTEEFDPMLQVEINPNFYTGREASTSLSYHNNQCVELYKELINAGVASECARMVLPLATATTLYMTGNVRSWIHMLDVRDDEHAQLEIQLIAKEIKKIFIDQFPIISKTLSYI